MQATQTTEKPLTQVKSQKDLHKEVDASGAWSVAQIEALFALPFSCLLYTSPSPRDRTRSRMPSSA